MRCPFCKTDETKVTDKRQSGESIRRRRECLECKKRFTTYEKLSPVEKYVIKKDGRREPFNKDKILLGIIKACEKRNVSHEKITKIVDELENKLLIKNKEIETNKIGEFIMKKLKKVDNVAYIRFASVYRDFKDIEDFKEELRNLK